MNRYDWSFMVSNMKKNLVKSNGIQNLQIYFVENILCRVSRLSQNEITRVATAGPLRL